MFYFLKGYGKFNLKNISSIKKTECTGCAACMNVCNLNAITMVMNEGFFYPEINRNDCINCGKCFDICPVNCCNISKYNSLNIEKQECIAAKAKDKNVQLSSQSGGLFFLLSSYIIEQNGIVYGCILDDRFLAIHTRATTINELRKMRGSKYIQSETHTIYQSVKKDLEDNRLVLFSGVPCQIAALKMYLKMDYDNLITVDLICHGVNSPLVWSKYITWLENKTKAKCINALFRNKEKYGWGSHVESLYFCDKKGKIFSLDNTIFANIFYSHLALRNSCESCIFSSMRRVGDITLGDCWGIEQIAPFFYDKKGISLILLNSAKGKNFFEKIKNDIDLLVIDIEKVKQPRLDEDFSYAIPIEKRKQFWIDMNNKSFKYIALQYGIKSKIKRLLHIYPIQRIWL